MYKEKQTQLISPSRTDEMPAGFMNYFHYSISDDQLPCASDHESVCRSIFHHVSHECSLHCSLHYCLKFK